MTKRRKRGKRRTSGGAPRGPTSIDAATAAILGYADGLLEDGDSEAALELLADALSEAPDVAALPRRMAQACFVEGDLWGAMDAFERAGELGGDVEDWLNAAVISLRLQLNATALRAIRRAKRIDSSHDRVQSLVRIAEDIEQETSQLAERLRVSQRRAHRGLLAMHHGERALHQQDFPAAIRASRRASGLLPGYPPPLNNVALALFWSGEHEMAIETTKRVVAEHPDNIFALSSMVRFFVWTGRQSDAQKTWSHLKGLTPRHRALHHKIAQAAAAMEDDWAVLAALEPVLGPDSADEDWSQESQLLLATAQANVGRHEQALARLDRIGLDDARTQAIAAALRAGRPGVGWTSRYPYYDPFELTATQPLVRLIELASPDSVADPDAARTRIDALVAKYPQVVRVLERIIWEDAKPQIGVPLLAIVGTEQAYAALRRYGLSKAGPDSARVEALGELWEAGELNEGPVCRVWLEGEWRNVRPETILGHKPPYPDYPPEVERVLASAEIAVQHEDLDLAAEHLREALEMEPESKELYDSLAALCLQRGEVAEGKALLETALRIDPAFVLARVHLAAVRLDEEGPAAARKTLEPIACERSSSEFGEAYYYYTMARIAVEEDDFPAAKASVARSLAVLPDFGPSLRLLDGLNQYEAHSMRLTGFMEDQRERWRRRRMQMQKALVSPDPSVYEALAIQTKDTLTAMARVLPVRSGWSTLRKADLLHEVERTLLDEKMLALVTRHLPEDEADALKAIMAQGGSMPWADFAARFGDDMDECPFWEYEPPSTLMGRMRVRGLLAETIVGDELLAVVPSEIRQFLAGFTCFDRGAAAGEGNEEATDGD